MRAAFAVARKWALPLIVLGGLAFAVTTSWSTLGRGLRVVVSANVIALVCAAVLEAGSYLVLSTVLQRLAGDGQLSFGHAVRAGLVAVGLGRILPASPVEGMVMTARELEPRGLSKRRAFVAVGLAQWYFARALFATAAVACLSVAALDFVNHRYLDHDVVWLSVATVVFVGVFVIMGLLVARAHVLVRIGRFARRVPLLRARADAIHSSLYAWTAEVRASAGDRGRRLRLFALACVASALDAACFFASFRAVGVHASTAVIIAAYGIGMVGALMPLTPAGIGVMEVAVPAFLVHTHVRFVAALGGVLTYRLIAWFAPAVIGFGVLGHFRASALVASRRHRD